jgi:hypothetical protein
LLCIYLLVFTGLLFCGCRTVYGPVKRRLPGEQVREGGVIEKPVVTKDDSLRSQNYRYTSSLPKPELDRIMAAMEQYHLQMFEAIRPRWKELPKYVDVVIPESKATFSRMVGASGDVVMDADFVAVVPSKRKIVILHSSKWKEFSRKLFRAQARMFFHDAIPHLPLWLVEGMISFFQEVAIGGIGGETKFKIIGYNAENLNKVQELIKSDKFPELAGVMTIAERKKLTDADKLAVWAFVYWSQHSGKGSQRAFKEFLKALKGKSSGEVKIEEHLRMPLQEFDKRWRKWLLRQQVYLERKVQDPDRAKGK